MRFINPNEYNYYVVLSKRESYVDDIREVSNKKIKVSVTKKDKILNNGKVKVGVDLVRYIRNNQNVVNENLKETLFHAKEVPKGRFHIEYDDIDFIEEVLKGTIEGQEFLERLISDFTSWKKPMKILKPKRKSEQDLVWCSDYKYMGYDDEEKWKSMSKESFGEIKRNSNPLEEYFGHWVFNQKQKVSYAIELVDPYLKKWVYVGDSTSVLNRLKQHINRGGDFSEAKGNELEVTEILEVSKTDTEKELYQKYLDKSSIPEERICGGK